MKHKYLYITFLVVALCSCSEYTKLQKATDPDVKFDAGKNYFAEKKYVKAVTMFESIVQYYRGTPRAEELLFLLAESHMGQKSYMSASNYYDAYIRNFPRGRFSQDARYQLAYCYYLDSPDPRLDQTATNEALTALYEYVEIYPESERVGKCQQYIDELENKLAYKELQAAVLYYNLGLYGGNNYRACVVTAENALRDFPNTQYRDDLVFIILRSKAKEAANSVPEKKRERYSEVIDEYYRYANEFADGKHIREANRLLREARGVVK